MKVGDILILLDDSKYDQYNKVYTKNKHYIIFKIDDNFIPGCRCGYIKDNFGIDVYFRENEATDDNWRYLKDIRKEKLKKLDENRH